jgi:L-lysine 2,3-aminomutase
MKKRPPEDVISSGGEPFLAYERAIREILMILAQKMDNDIGKLHG